MPEETASMANVSRTNFTGGGNNRTRNKSGVPYSQCTPMPLPARGTQMIIKGNGTNVGSVISLKCPIKYKLIGSEVECVMGANSTHWSGQTYCKPLSHLEDIGFCVAVLASIVSSAIILLLLMAFITCCLLESIKNENKKKQAGERNQFRMEEQNEQPVENRARRHKGRNKNNNNNNNNQEMLLPEWDDHNPALGDKKRACRCHHHSPCGLTGPPSACSNAPAPPPLAPLPGRDYDQSLLPWHTEPAQGSGLPQQLEHIQSSCQPNSSCLIQISGPTLRSGPGLVWQMRGQEDSSSGMNQSAVDESNTRSIKSANELSIRIISV